MNRPIRKNGEIWYDTLKWIPIVSAESGESLKGKRVIFNPVSLTIDGEDTRILIVWSAYQRSKQTVFEDPPLIARYWKPITECRALSLQIIEEALNNRQKNKSVKMRKKGGQSWQTGLRHSRQAHYKGL